MSVLLDVKVLLLRLSLLKLIKIQDLFEKEFYSFYHLL